MPLQYVVSKRGKQQLVVNGYVFSQRSVNVDGSVQWRCIQRDHCRETAITSGEEFKKVPSEVHESHAPSRGDVVKREVGERLREEGRNGATPASAVNRVVSLQIHIYLQ